MDKREIKFRVWNGVDMIHDVTVGKFGVFYVNPGDKGNGLDPKDSASLTPFNTKYHEDTPVMQFTGLLDKNGVEIYEGDRLRREDFADWIVIWNNGGFYIYNDCRPGDLYKINKYECLEREVIGNIFQPPIDKEPQIINNNKL